MYLSILFCHYAVSYTFYKTLIKCCNHPGAPQFKCTGSAYQFACCEFMYTAAVQSGLQSLLDQLKFSIRKHIIIDNVVATRLVETFLYYGSTLGYQPDWEPVFRFMNRFTVGALPCLAISASVTSFGRQMIEKSREVIMQQMDTSMMQTPT